MPRRNSFQPENFSEVTGGEDEWDPRGEEEGKSGGRSCQMLSSGGARNAGRGKFPEEGEDMIGRPETCQNSRGLPKRFNRDQEVHYLVRRVFGLEDSLRGADDGG